jgi:hypothetical protein
MPLSAQRPRSENTEVQRTWKGGHAPWQLRISEQRRRHRRQPQRDNTGRQLGRYPPGAQLRLPAAFVSLRTFPPVQAAVLSAQQFGVSSAATRNAVGRCAWLKWRCGRRTCGPGAGRASPAERQSEDLHPGDTDLGFNSVEPALFRLLPRRRIGRLPGCGPPRSRIWENPARSTRLPSVS